MRVALVAPLYETVPPRGYGGTERVVAGLADQLVEDGHDVTLFAAGGSRTAARQIAAVPAPLRTSMTRQELMEVAPHLHLQMLADVYRQAEQFDIVHAHTDIWTLPFVRLCHVPTVITMHGRLDLDAVQRVFPLYPDLPLVSISDHQRVALDHFPVRWAGTCYNGLPLDRFLEADPVRGDHLVFMGRITPEKRPDLAVEIARRTGRRLRVAAKVDPLDTEYWTDVIEPLFARNDVEYVGEITEAEKPEFLAGARAMVFPIDWPEPFGLVMIESLAAGTPVIALRRGSVPEIVEHGRSGLICDSLDEMVDAVSKTDGITAEACRTRAQQFTSATMTRRYLEIYESVIARHRSRPTIVRDTEANRVVLS